MTRAVLDVRPLDSSEWRTLRDTRLRALRDAPRAFTADYDRERQVGDDEWRRRLGSGAWVVATEDGAVIGIAGLISGDPGESEHVESVWVAPTHRERGVWGALLAQVKEIAREARMSHLWLWVLEDNLRARRAYARSGFVWTGERKMIDPEHRRFERRLLLTI